LHDNECKKVDRLSLEQHFIRYNSRVEAEEDCREGIAVDVEVPKAPGEPLSESANDKKQRRATYIVIAHKLSRMPRKK